MTQKHTGLRKKIIKLMESHPRGAMTYKQLMKELQIGHDESGILARELKNMIKEGLVIKTQRTRYGLPGRLGMLTGVLQGNRRGFAFLQAGSQEEDVYISRGNLKGAVHGDRVAVLLSGGSRRRRREGEVVSILQRGNFRLVGTLERRGRRYYVIPDEKRFSQKIEVFKGDLHKAVEGEKVVVDIQTWPGGREMPRGRIVERLGLSGTRGAENLSLHRKYNLPGEFPPPALKELDTLPGEEEISRLAGEKGRADLRRLPLVTIDDETARDFDDAVSLENLDDGSFRLGVHIADVSYYVKERKGLDREALDRATSTYLVDRVIHMLPPLLSEKLCSLQAGRDRLAVSVFMDLTPAGDLISYRFTESLINVTERLTYRQVEQYLQGHQDKKAFQNPFLGEIVTGMDRLAKQLRQKRFQRGALDLNLPEAQITLDDQGVPTAVERRSAGRSESLIEEFMILTNETVAGHFAREKLPFLYRIHAVPADDKLASLRETLSLVGMESVQKIKELKPKHLKKLLEEVKGKPRERLVSFLLLRSLPQARYSSENEGHFGLASGFYCHFTSPIRRYPDLVVHRILKQYLKEGSLTEKGIARLRSTLPAVAQHTSEREREAMEAERASEDMMKAQYMAGKLGEIFPGIISGVTNFGIFVELENTIEGMIPVSELHDDYYVYHEKMAALVGERTRKRYRLGDNLQVQVAGVSRAEGNITFALAPEAP